MTFSCARNVPIRSACANVEYGNRRGFAEKDPRGHAEFMRNVLDHSGVGSALGVLAFDSSTLTNGVHTIAWVVTDNQGAADGVGSRYFT